MTTKAYRDYNTVYSTKASKRKNGSQKAYVQSYEIKQKHLVEEVEHVTPTFTKVQHAKHVLSLDIVFTDKNTSLEDITNFLNDIQEKCQKLKLIEP